MAVDYQEAAGRKYLTAIFRMQQKNWKLIQESSATRRVREVTTTEIKKPHRTYSISYSHAVKIYAQNLSKEQSTTPFFEYALIEILHSL